MATKNSRSSVDLVRFSVLAHVAQWLEKHGATDLTQIQDEYILRQMAKYDCFSLKDVLEARDQLALQLGLPDILPAKKSSP